MNIDAEQISKMSTSEKLHLMELLWADLSKNQKDVKTPDWHKDALKEAEERYEAGEEKILEWDDVKRDLRNKYG